MIRKIEALISLPAVDMPRAVAFYAKTLALKILYEGINEDFYIFQGEEGGPLIGLHGHEGTLPAPDPGGVWLWLEVEAIAPVRQRLETQGVRFLGETIYLGPGYEAPFVDTEGNVLRLYEPLQEVRRTITIEAHPQAVFAALTDARQIEQWFAAIHSVALEARAGGRITFVDPLFGPVEGRVVELTPPERIVFTFTQNWPTRLEFTLTAADGATRLELRQSGFEAIRDRDFNMAKLVANVEAALKTLAERAPARR